MSPDAPSIRDEAAIVGIGQTAFARHLGRSEYGSALEAILAACVARRGVYDQVPSVAWRSGCPQRGQGMRSEVPSMSRSGALQLGQRRSRRSARDSPRFRAVMSLHSGQSARPPQ